MPDSLALDSATRVYEQLLTQIDVTGLSIGIPRGPGVAMHEGEGYADALIDLSRLLEEYRFEAAVGALYAAGVKDEVTALRESAEKPPHNAGFSNKARAMLAGIIAQGAPPAKLLTDPKGQMAGMRILGGWWAAQLYDSALMRGVAVLDRLVTLLYYVEGQKVDVDWMPAFRGRTLRKLQTWQDESEWTNLMAILDSPLFVAAKGYRDGLVHRSRYAMELHGDFAVGRFDSDGHLVELGSGGDVHFGLVAAFHNEILRGAVEDTAALITRTMGARGVPLPPA